jgi:type I site-specific restriction endonuclease
MTTPEQRARQTIDALLSSAGWQVQDRAALDLGAGGARVPFQKS